ncbi:MAG: PD-(D/E)XK nuclease domain-containing protein, partial [Prevotellaceae bacterium]|nr:PD-(D/E)XK nuclease domain-containing protein [Prevotellaceae bacterium]
LDNKTEKHYQTIFYIFFKLMGQFVQAEPRSAVGRADAVVTLSDTVYIFEFKLAERDTAEAALKQIDDRCYAMPYAASGKRVVKVGAEFSSETRTLGKWKVKK